MKLVIAQSYNNPNLIYLTKNKIDAVEIKVETKEIKIKEIAFEDKLENDDSWKVWEEINL